MMARMHEPHAAADGIEARHYRIAADTTPGVVFADLTSGRNVKRQELQQRDAVRAVAVAHKLNENEVTEIIEVRWINSPEGEVICA